MFSFANSAVRLNLHVRGADRATHRIDAFAAGLAIFSEKQQPFTLAGDSAQFAGTGDLL